MEALGHIASFLLIAQEGGGEDSGGDSAQASVFSIASPCMCLTIILVWMPWV